MEQDIKGLLMCNKKYVHAKYKSMVKKYVHAKSNAHSALILAEQLRWWQLKYLTMCRSHVITMFLLHLPWRYEEKGVKRFKKCNFECSPRENFSILVSHSQNLQIDEETIRKCDADCISLSNKLQEDGWQYNYLNLCQWETAKLSIRRKTKNSNRRFHG